MTGPQSAEDPPSRRRELHEDPASVGRTMNAGHEPLALEVVHRARHGLTGKLEVTRQLRGLRGRVGPQHPEESGLSDRETEGTAFGLPTGPEPPEEVPEDLPDLLFDRCLRSRREGRADRWGYHSTRHGIVPLFDVAAPLPTGRRSRAAGGPHRSATGSARGRGGRERPHVR